MRLTAKMTKDDYVKLVQDYPYEVVMPFKNMTKVEIVKYFLDKYWNPELLWEESRSCYLGNEKECGVCRSCLRKYVALKLNGIYTKGIFEFEPESKKIMEEFLKESIEKNRHEEILDIKKVIEMIKK